MNLQQLPRIEPPEYFKSRQQVVTELQNVINRINSIPYDSPMSMTSRNSGDWEETIITGGMDSDSFVVTIFTFEEKRS